MDQPPFHVPRFHPSQPLSAWPGCTVELRCGCGRSSMPAVQLLLERHGDQPIGPLVRRMRCQGCGAAFLQAWLVAGLHRTCHGGPHPDWAVEIKPGV